MANPGPLIGYNTNVKHRGKLFHIQTEDSGVKHPHVMTHLFADGGRIVSSRKTSYAEHVGAPNLTDKVKALMQAQHKAMFLSLRNGEFDKDPVFGDALYVAAQSISSDPSTLLQAHDSSQQPSGPGDRCALSRERILELTLDEVILDFISEED